jgi:hypothetical protein
MLLEPGAAHRSTPYLDSLSDNTEKREQKSFVWLVMVIVIKIEMQLVSSGA